MVWQLCGQSRKREFTTEAEVHIEVLKIGQTKSAAAKLPQLLGCHTSKSRFEYMS